MKKLDIAGTDEEAAERALTYRETDPYPSIPASLLSSAEIYHYVSKTGMVHPFSHDDLKSASYQIYLGGNFIYWASDGTKHSKVIGRKITRSIVLPANSICFVEVESRFRLPDYIAIRFNLKITHVHRGLLLGTGPLVDPGFDGKILVPLHNLTDSDCEIDLNEALIWVEFTKTTFGFSKTGEYEPDPSHFKPFPPRKNEMDANQYLERANSGRPIRSSIPKAIVDALQAAQAAESAAGRLRNFGLLGLLGIIFAGFAAVMQTHSLVQDAVSLSNSVRSDLKDTAVDTKINSGKAEETDKQIADLQREIQSTKDGLSQAQQRLIELQTRIDSLRTLPAPRRNQRPPSRP